MKEICAFAPATIANINVGFDILGLALKSIGDKVILNFNNTEINRVLEIKNGENLPFEAEENCCTVVIRKMQEKLNSFKGVDVKIHKGFAAGSGLGSSSASSAAAAVAYNAILGNPFSKEELVFFAAEGERIACGTAHLDNVAPAILGGLVFIHHQKLIQLPLSKGLFAVSFFPNIKVKTSDARAILKTSFPLDLLTKQVANMGAFVSSLYENNLDLFSESLQDLIVEPTRKLLIPHFDEMKKQVLENEGLAFGISGSGPSVFALAKSETDALKIQSVLHKIYENSGIKTESYIESLNNNKGTIIC